MFNPLQTQAALQNPAQFPDQRLQQYAAGQPPQPTGQVMPGPFGPAGLELTSRNAQRQAAGRAKAMENNPQESPTIFQQKDMELQQKAQQLAAMGQQIQQKEQKLGVLGALMAKKTQDLLARGSGIPTLPMRDDIFTAMDGGIVFSGGGGVQRFDGTKNIDPAQLSDPLGRFGGLREDTPVPSALLATQPAGTTRLGGIASQLKSDLLRAIEPSNEEQQRAAQLIKLTQAKIEALKNSELSAEDKTKLINDEVRRLENILGEYTTGRAARTEKARAAIEGEAPTFQDRIGRGLGALAGADFNKLRIGEAFARMGAGARTADEAYAQRQREAAKFQADSEEKFAQADMLAKMGFTEKAQQLAAQAQTEKLALAKIKAEAIGAEQAGITALQAQDEKRRDNILNMLPKVATVRMQEEEFAAAPARKEAALRLEAQLKRELEGATGGKTDLQTRAKVAYEVLKEENAKLPPDQRKSDAKLRNEAFGLAETALLGSRRTSAEANALRAATTNAKNVNEALQKLQFLRAYIEADDDTKKQMEDEVRRQFPASGGMPSDVTRPPKKDSPPPPPGFVLNPLRN